MVVIVAGFAGLFGLVDFGYPAFASGTTNENVKRSQTDERSAGAPTNEASALSVPHKPGIQPKSKTSPPPKSDRPLEFTGKRPRVKEKPAGKKRRVDRPPKEKNRRSPVKKKPPKEKRVVVRRSEPPPSDPRRPHPQPPLPPPPPPLVIEYVDYYDPGPGEASLESYSVLLTATSLVLNGVYIQAGERNVYAAVAGLVIGATSIAVGSSDTAEAPVLDYLLGAASIALSIWNLTGGIHRVDPYASDEEVGVYHAGDAASDSTPHTVLYSFSF